MNLDMEAKVLKYIENIDNAKNTTIVVRLYDEYQKNINKSSQSTNEITLIKLKNSYNNIVNSITHFDYNYYSVDVIKYIRESILILKSDFSSFDFKDKKQVKRTLTLITILESLLKISITFPFMLKECLENELNTMHKNEEFYNGRKYHK